MNKNQAKIPAPAETSKREAGWDSRFHLNSMPWKYDARLDEHCLYVRLGRHELDKKPMTSDGKLRKPPPTAVEKQELSKIEKVYMSSNALRPSRRDERVPLSIQAELEKKFAKNVKKLETLWGELGVPEEERERFRALHFSYITPENVAAVKEMTDMFSAHRSRTIRVMECAEAREVLLRRLNKMVDLYQYSSEPTQRVIVEDCKSLVLDLRRATRDTLEALQGWGEGHYDHRPFIFVDSLTNQPHNLSVKMQHDLDTFFDSGLASATGVVSRENWLLISPRGGGGGTRGTSRSLSSGQSTRQSHSRASPKPAAPIGSRTQSSSASSRTQKDRLLPPLPKSTATPSDQPQHQTPPRATSSQSARLAPIPPILTVTSSDTNHSDSQGALPPAAPLEQHSLVTTGGKSSEQTHSEPAVAAKRTDSTGKVDSGEKPENSHKPPEHSGAKTVETKPKETVPHEPKPNGNEVPAPKESTVQTQDSVHAEKKDIQIPSATKPTVSEPKKDAAAEKDSAKGNEKEHAKGEWDVVPKQPADLTKPVSTDQGNATQTPKTEASQPQPSPPVTEVHEPPKAPEQPAKVEKKEEPKTKPETAAQSNLPTKQPEPKDGAATPPNSDQAPKTETDKSAGHPPVVGEITKEPEATKTIPPKMESANPPSPSEPGLNKGGGVVAGDVVKLPTEETKRTDGKSAAPTPPKSDSKHGDEQAKAGAKGPSAPPNPTQPKAEDSKPAQPPAPTPAPNLPKETRYTESASKTDTAQPPAASQNKDDGPVEEAYDDDFE